MKLRIGNYIFLIFSPVSEEAMELLDLLPSATEEDMAVTVGAKIVHHNGPEEEEEENEFPMSNVVQVSPAVLRKQMPFMPQASAVISAVISAVKQPFLSVAKRRCLNR